jgi:serine protease
MRRVLLLAAVAALAAPAGAQAATPPYVPGEVVVKYAGSTTAVARAAAQRASGAANTRPAPGLVRTLRVKPGTSVAAAAAALRRRRGVEYAVPNLIAHASGFIPNDPGRIGTPAGWQELQWNFAPDNGVDAPDAWTNVANAGHPGGSGVTVAVLDTGVAYTDRGRYRRSPDFGASRFVRGYDFVDHDPYPNDENGHGTHVAGTIAERTNNGYGLTGLAYGVKIMPVRVLDSRGEGDAANIAAGIRYAARRGAQVINLSLEFSSSVRAIEIPEILDAVRYANHAGALMVGASGNEADSAVAYPARADPVMSVGATTEHGCLADYSNDGQGLDIVAPGGGSDARLKDDPVHCQPLAEPGRDIFQVTFAGSVRDFGIEHEEGTSMAAPHVAAIAALVIASGVLGPHPKPAAVEDRLKATARDLGPPGYDTRYGAGLVNAAAATAPPAPPPPPPAPPPSP